MGAWLSGNRLPSNGALSPSVHGNNGFSNTALQFPCRCVETQAETGESPEPSPAYAVDNNRGTCLKKGGRQGPTP